MAKVNATTATIGLRAKTGRAIAVVLAGLPTAPHVIKRLEFSVVDPAAPETFQPYHEVLDLPWEQAQKRVQKMAGKIERVATKALRTLIRELASEGVDVRAVGVVGAGERNLEKIGSTHIRAHAAEGVLFRQVLEVAAESNDLPSRRFDERTIEGTAETELKIPVASIKAHLAEMGREAGSPWRADEKSAATAAWIVLASRN
ncbi:MAG TPA: hypothetical protein VN937_07375 [Blastocatellia bacterium]|nr:hypothetical protein [Blastocatellia bacterium]